MFRGRFNNVIIFNLGSNKVGSEIYLVRAPVISVLGSGVFCVYIFLIELFVVTVPGGFLVWFRAVKVPAQGVLNDINFLFY